MNEAEGVGVGEGFEAAPGVEVEAGGAMGWESAGEASTRCSRRQI